MNELTVGTKVKVMTYGQPIWKDGIPTGKTTPDTFELDEIAKIEIREVGAFGQMDNVYLMKNSKEWIRSFNLVNL